MTGYDPTAMIGYDLLTMIDYDRHCYDLATSMTVYDWW